MALTLAFDRGEGDWTDRAIRAWTGGQGAGYGGHFRTVQGFRYVEGL